MSRTAIGFDCFFLNLNVELFKKRLYVVGNRIYGFGGKRVLHGLLFDFHQIRTLVGMVEKRTAAANRSMEPPGTEPGNSCGNRLCRTFPRDAAETCRKQSHYIILS